MLQSQDDEAIEASLLPPAVEEAGVIPAALLDLFRCQNPELTQLTIAAMLILPSSTANKLKAMALLENIVSSSENSIQEGTGGAIRVLAEAVEEGSPQVQRACHQNPPYMLEM
ncbi:hypothetical protein Gotri_015856 [Gossypium trilobum]|uniref:Uncharacterized protein n=1 Tax=Gossypium trilobum TaxID=34281 RepID=A0A7J9E1H2_9ROSI|nr:hypothetical protein [Gossypium trilobum]